MANAKEQFGLADKPEIHGVVEHETTPVAVDEYSKQVEAELKKPEAPKAKAVNKKVPAFKLTVRGNVRNGEKMEAYSVDVVIPECPEEELQYHIQRFVNMELVKQGNYHDGVINRSIDEIEESTLEFTFIGKDVFSLSKEEIQYACDYYGIRGCAYNNPSIRALQREFYKKYLIKTDSSLAEPLAQAEFITKVDAIIDYKKLPKIKLEA